MCQLMQLTAILTVPQFALTHHSKIRLYNTRPSIMSAKYGRISSIFGYDYESSTAVCSAYPASILKHHINTLDVAPQSNPRGIWPFRLASEETNLGNTRAWEVLQKWASVHSVCQSNSNYYCAG